MEGVAEVVLTEEQKARIASSRQNALKRKLQVAEEVKLAEAALKEDCSSCQCVIDTAGSLCGAKPVAQDLLLIFGESCCEACRHLTDDFGLINKTDLASQFLIPQDSIKMMKFTTKLDPRNSAFAPMKLYLRKHAMEKSMKRWGDAAGLLRELDRREKERSVLGLGLGLGLVRALGPPLTISIIMYITIIVYSTITDFYPPCPLL